MDGARFFARAAAMSSALASSSSFVRARKKAGGGGQGAVLLLRRRQREFARGLARLAAQRQQARFKIAGPAVDHVQAFHRHRSSVFTGLKMGSEI